MSLSFEAPGKGSWEMDATHCPKPLVPILQECFAPGLGEGMRQSCARYGALLETLTVRYVHGFPYVQAKPLGAPEGASGMPPKFLFKLILWLHPAIRARLRTAASVFEDKPWRVELAEWDATVKPRTVARHRGLARVDLAALDDDALGEHLIELRDHALRMVAQDHGYNLAFMLPIGDYLAHVTRWTGASGAELMALLRGTSETSAGEVEERRLLLAAVRAEPEARRLLESGDDEAVVEGLLGREGAIGEAMTDYLLIVGAAPALGLDLCAPSLREQPRVLVASLRAGLTAPARGANGVHEAAEHVRSRVPAAHRDAFDELLEDARLVYRLRDERHVYGAIPCCWLARRAWMEAGRRLVARGSLPSAELALHTGTRELRDALQRRAELDIAALEQAQRRHRELDGWSVPATLGPTPDRPPNDWLPPVARRMADAFDAYFHHSSEPEMEKPTGDAIRGLGVSPGIHEGIARRCESTDDLQRIEPGDVLVAQTTTVAINVALPILGAIVTDRGGALCHAAIVCREYGIPGVVGTKVATKRIREGDRVRVDGVRGIVELVR